MGNTHANELLFDSEASLRLVDRALTDLQVSRSSTDAHGSLLEISGATLQEVALMDLPNMLLRAYTEINGVLQNLRHSRDVLQQTTMEKLHHTNDKLREVSSATEIAATDMLDGLDRALVMIDDLDAQDGSGSSDRSVEIRGNLRNELFGLMNCLQFQDITTQQLNYASSVLLDMEQRLAEIAEIFDPDRLGLRPKLVETVAPTQPAFDPAATTMAAEERQALVDAIFTQR